MTFTVPRPPFPRIAGFHRSESHWTFELKFNLVLVIIGHIIFVSSELRYIPTLSAKLHYDMQPIFPSYIWDICAIFFVTYMVYNIHSKTFKEIKK